MLGNRNVCFNRHHQLEQGTSKNAQEDVACRSRARATDGVFSYLRRMAQFRNRQNLKGPDCVKTWMFRLRDAVPEWPILCPDRLHQTTNAQNADYPFHVVGQDV